MADRLLGDNVVMGMHIDFLIEFLRKAKELMEKNAFGEAKHELTKALLEAEEARSLFKKLNK